MAHILARPCLVVFALAALCAASSRAGGRGIAEGPAIGEADGAARAALTERHVPGLALVIARGDDALRIRIGPAAGGEQHIRLFMGAMHWYGTRVAER
jgi:hypothetical protein